MNTLKMANTLIDAGFNKSQAESIVEIVDSRDKELATKKDMKIIYGMFSLVGVAFAYAFDLLNTIISKLA
ncbi:hypothetical protein [Candidatus Thioglobus sp.]|uniref:hypothetical protein n=1 Tax=Candidatus Thioglobus sp. TaxID=2026721 RepID=UPI003D098E89